jgi:pyruvate formate lyase activating enzyme
MEPGRHRPGLEMDSAPRSPVYGVLQNASMVDFPGRLAAVFFLTGCNFKCGFCHNAALMNRTGAAGLPWTEVEQICRKFRDNWVAGAVVTGGEPTLNPGVFHIVEKLREWGVAIKLDTNGSRPGVLEKLLPRVDYVAMDVKFAPADYSKRVGFADVAALTESIRLIREKAAAYEFRTTVIEAWHDADSMRAIGEWVRGGELHVLQAFVPRAELPDPACRAMPETRAEILRACADLLRPYVARVEIRGEF